MADDFKRRAAAERRAWAEDEFTVYPPGAPVHLASNSEDEEGDDEE